MPEMWLPDLVTKHILAAVQVWWGQSRQSQRDKDNSSPRVVTASEAAAAPQKPQTLTFLCVCVQIKQRAQNMSVIEKGKYPEPASTPLR